MHISCQKSAQEKHKMAQSCCKSGLWWQLLHFSCQNVVWARHICFRCFALFLSSQSSALSSKPGMLKKSKRKTYFRLCMPACAVVSKHSIASSDRGHTKRKFVCSIDNISVPMPLCQLLEWCPTTSNPSSWSPKHCGVPHKIQHSAFKAPFL